MSTEIASAQPEQESRRAHWQRQASLTGRAGVVSKVVMMGSRFITIPIALRLLGPEHYGLWLTVTSLMAWLGFAANGIGSGLVNALSNADQQAPAIVRRHISTAVFTLLPLSLLLLGCAAALSAWPGVSSILGVGQNSPAAGAARQLVLVAGAVFAASFALDFLMPLCLGLQRGYLTSFSSIAGNIGVVGAVAAVGYAGGDVIAFALAVGMPPVLANLALTAYLFGYRHPELRPHPRQWNRASFRLLMSFGGYMLIGYIGELIIFQAPNILISNRFGAAAVPAYAVPAAIFLNLTNACYLLVTPYWPALREAGSRSDWTWVRGAFLRTLRLTVGLMAAAALGVALAGRPLIQWWAGQHAVPTQFLLVCMAVYFALMVWSGNNVILLLSQGFVEVRALLMCIVAAAHLAGFWLLAPSFEMAAWPMAGAVGILIEGTTAMWVAFRHIRRKEAIAQPA
jgi:O-antigen/teichoic acid export membrane protein